MGLRLSAFDEDPTDNSIEKYFKRKRSDEEPSGKSDFPECPLCGKTMESDDNQAFNQHVVIKECASKVF
jgi:hypothetical protein